MEGAEDGEGRFEMEPAGRDGRSDSARRLPLSLSNAAVAAAPASSIGRRGRVVVAASEAAVRLAPCSHATVMRRCGRATRCQGIMDRLHETRLPKSQWAVHHRTATNTARRHTLEPSLHVSTGKNQRNLNRAAAVQQN